MDSDAFSQSTDDGDRQCCADADADPHPDGHTDSHTAGHFCSRYADEDHFVLIAHTADYGHAHAYAYAHASHTDQDTVVPHSDASATYSGTVTYSHGSTCNRSTATTTAANTAADRHAGATHRAATVADETATSACYSYASPPYTHAATPAVADQHR